MKTYLLKGDINGIQKFIYKVYEGEGGVAKILRARSFYISVIPNFIIKFIKDKFKDSWECEEVLNGGGGFILRVRTEDSPDEFKGKVEDIRKHVEEFFLLNLYGEVGITFGFVEEKEEETNIDRLQEEVDKEKKRKFRRALSSSLLPKSQEGVFLLDKREETAPLKKCKVCRTFFSVNEVCDFCQTLRKLGEVLPYSVKEEVKPFGEGYSGYSDLTVSFADKGYFLDLKLSERHEKIESLITVPFWNVEKLKGEKDKLPKEVRRIIEEEESKGIKRKKEIAVAPFEVIALSAEGDKKLGYLIMDVDNLGLIFGRIRRPELADKISKRIDSFFKEKVKEIALSEKFKPKEEEFIFNTYIYILYAGGDDLFAIGPWDKLLNFAVEVDKAFKEFASSLDKDTKIQSLMKEDNKIEFSKLLSLSAGFITARPKFTVRVAAYRCQEEEKRAKKGGKNAISAFGEVLRWDDGESRKVNQVEELIKECKKWIDYVKKEKIPRRFFYRLYALYREKMENAKDYMFYPYIHYVIARTIKDEKAKEELLKLVNGIEDKTGIKFLCNYVLTATRGMKWELRNIKGKKLKKKREE